MSLTKSIEPIEEEKSINKIMTIKTRALPEIIVSESLQKSIEIIAKYDYKYTTDETIIEYKKCYFCKNQFPTIPGKEYSCQKCGEIFCVSHRNVLKHQCQKLDANLEKYLAAKNLFKEKMRMIKMKGH